MSAVVRKTQPPGLSAAFNFYSFSWPYVLYTDSNQNYHVQNRPFFDRVEMKAEFAAQRFLNLLEFVLAQHAVVHEDATQARFPLGKRATCQ